MKEITTFEEFRGIQFLILQDIDSFLRKHNINYSMAYGSLIGVVRHKGFIPWDDDIDIFMERDQYNRFIDIFPQIYLGKYTLACLEKSTKWNRPYAKVYDVRTLLVESVSNNTGIGVGIDVFPIDETPERKVLYRLYINMLSFLRSLYTIKSLKWMPNRSIYKNVFIYMAKLFLLPFGYRAMAVFISFMAQFFNGKNTGYLADNAEGYRSTKPFLKESFEEYINMPFEGYSVMVMKGWNDVLTKCFGNFWQLPPEDKRFPHHVYKAYWK